MNAVRQISTRAAAPGHVRPALLALMIGASLAGCQLTRDRSPETPPPAPLEAAAPAPRPAPPPAAPSPPAERPDAVLRAARAQSAQDAALVARERAADPASQAGRDYYRAAEAQMRSRGLLRAAPSFDPAAMDAATLAHNFVQIALYNEYRRQDGMLVPGPVAAPLRRWTEPVRIQIVFGESVSPAQRTSDRAQIARYAALVSEATGHPVSLVRSGGNFSVMILNETERRALSPERHAALADLPAEDLAAIRRLPRENYCAVFAYSLAGGAEYVQAVAILREELPPRLRQSCIQEEIAQGLGLANDYDNASPSIFNDNMRYAELTGHDALLLRILYDTRLRPGMREAEAAPIARQIAGELLAERGE
ncbi:MAG: DUF2927 domain-containing protein [Paracoccus sp. (in: a-proteobacteria)]|nr:DUF2927 domain-containing protein [Paracoccus sp. (in: a-proteobacteria)]